MFVGNGVQLIMSPLKDAVNGPRVFLTSFRIRFDIGFQGKHSRTFIL